MRSVVVGFVLHADETPSFFAPHIIIVVIEMPKGGVDSTVGTAAGPGICEYVHVTVMTELQIDIDVPPPATAAV